MFLLKSMTGFGRCETEINGRTISAEIKTVNHRYYDFSCRTTRGYGFLEEKLKGYIQKSISRGKVDVFVSVGANNEAPSEVRINHSLAAGYVAALTELKDTYGLAGELSPAVISRFPDIFTVCKSAEDEEEIWQQVKTAVDSAVESLVNMRIAEGQRLKDDILSKAEKILQIVSEIEKQNPCTVNSYRMRIEEKMRELLGDANVDEQRLLTETAIFADKVAVDEEIVRLRSHFEALNTMLEAEQPIGRKLDFLVQEMNRETNTIGSKAQDAEMAHMVVDIKSELEKIREQIQNIE